MSSFLLIDIGNSRLKWASVDGKRNPIERDKKLWDHSGAIDTKLLGSKEHVMNWLTIFSIPSQPQVRLGFAVWQLNLQYNN